MATFIALAGMQSALLQAFGAALTAVANKASTPAVDAALDEFTTQQKRIWQLMDWAGAKIGAPAPLPSVTTEVAK